jgi:hypothetical protein
VRKAKRAQSRRLALRKREISGRFLVLVLRNCEFGGCLPFARVTLAMLPQRLDHLFLASFSHALTLRLGLTTVDAGCKS